MTAVKDGPASPLFSPVEMAGNISLSELANSGVSDLMVENSRLAPVGECICWGMRFQFDDVVLAKGEPVKIELGGLSSQWLVFSHVTDLSASNRLGKEFVQLGPARVPVLGFMSQEPVADYVFVYDDGSEVSVTIHGGRQIAPFATRLDENCFEAVAHLKSMLTRWGDNETVRNQLWGRVQQQNFKPDLLRLWTNWLWCWQNPHPDKLLVSLRIEPADEATLLFGISAGNATSAPTRWRRRRKLIMRLGEGEVFDSSMSQHRTQGVMLEEAVGGYRQLDVDMGQIASIQPRSLYPNATWAESSNNTPPDMSIDQLLVEYSCHADAHFHLPGESRVSVREIESESSPDQFRPIPAATRKTRIRIVDRATNMSVAARLHIHGVSGEYLAPGSRQRNPNPHWFQDYGADYVHKSTHFNAYVDGEVDVYLPLGTVFLEVSKGFEFVPVRQTFEIDEKCDEIVLWLDNVIDWRSKGWLTADTHVHFLSPQTALLEGAAEGLNVVNLLASQWGEIFTNVGDFDGKTVFGEKDSQTDGEHLVRVGTENRQGVMGHISLLGYEGEMIQPLATGGPSESALGDPVAALLTDWAARCKAQKGTVIIPHFPLPRAEHAATIVAGLADAVELTSLGPLARGSLNAYDLADWYRYLNCGYFVAAVGGTDKMSASTAVGAGRTYARLQEGEEFSYQAWQDAVSRGQTFVTLGPLLDFDVDGNPPGSRMAMNSGGGTVAIGWQAESVTIPMSRIELIVNGEVRESQSIDGRRASGNWQVSVEKSSWVAILLRGREAGREEVIAAHSSPVMIAIEGSEFMAAADAMSILHQIEGTMAYLDSLGTRADTETYQSMCLTLTAVHRKLHDRMHAAGIFHQHNAVTHHEEHDEH